jgi:hypothetical protein
MQRIAWGVIVCAYGALAQNGAIRGKVGDDAGKSLNGAQVVIASQDLKNRTALNTKTTAQGDYEFANVPPGRYSICVQNPKGEHLGSCNWSTAAQLVVTAGQTWDHPPITIVRAAVLELRIDDPKGLITHTDNIRVQVLLPSGLPELMRLAASDPGGRTYEIPVPLNTAVRIQVLSASLLMKDHKGIVLDDNPGRRNPANASTTSFATNAVVGLPAQAAFKGSPIRFTVTGRK